MPLNRTAIRRITSVATHLICRTFWFLHSDHDEVGQTLALATSLRHECRSSNGSVPVQGRFSMRQRPQSCGVSMASLGTSAVMAVALLLQ